MDDFSLPLDLPVSLPSDLVRQRPDVRAAEANVHVASANVGVAVAARLPSFTLVAAPGGASTQLGTLFSNGNAFWSVTGSLAQTVFDAGALRHKQAAAQDALVQAKAQYRSAVLSGLQNTADVLQAIVDDAHTLKHAAAAEAAAARALRLARDAFEHGQTGVAAMRPDRRDRRPARCRAPAWSSGPGPLAMPTPSLCFRRWAAAGAIMPDGRGRPYSAAIDFAAPEPILAASAPRSHKGFARNGRRFGAGMIKSLPMAAAAAFCLALAAGPSLAAGVQMSPAVQRQLGVATTKLSLTHQAAEVDAFAKVLDPEPLVQLCSDLATAEAAAAASRAVGAARSQARCTRPTAGSPPRTWRRRSRKAARTRSRSRCCAAGWAWNGAPASRT